MALATALDTCNDELVNLQSADAEINPDGSMKRVLDNGAIVLSRTPVSLREAFIACSGTLLGWHIRMPTYRILRRFSQRAALRVLTPSCSDRPVVIRLLVAEATVATCA
jgi:hypothetical protein